MFVGALMLRGSNSRYVYRFGIGYTYHFCRCCGGADRYGRQNSRLRPGISAFEEFGNWSEYLLSLQNFTCQERFDANYLGRERIEIMETDVATEFSDSTS